MTPDAGLPQECPTAGWTDWHNNRGLHSTLVMMTPVGYEQAHYGLFRVPVGVSGAPVS